MLQIDESIKYSFIRQGSVVSARKHKLFLDVGNNLCLGVIDHHQPDAPPHSATMLLYKQPELIPDNVNEIIVHNNPDIDCCCSAWLATYFLKFKEFPDYAEELAKFADRIDFGKGTKNVLSLYSIYAFAKMSVKNDLHKLGECFDIIHKLSKFGFDTGVIPDDYAKYNYEIIKDVEFFRKDIMMSKVFDVYLPEKNSQKTAKVAGLIMPSVPKSRLFKDWARNGLNSKETGYDLLVVKLNNSRFIISVKPDCNYYLKGFGDILNAAEKRKRADKKVIIAGDIRPGYNMVDPWYDGRNAIHNYSIIDSPHLGTLLSLDEILNLFEFWGNSNKGCVQ